MATLHYVAKIKIQPYTIMFELQNLMIGQFSLTTIVLLVLAAVAAGYIDTLVGGGGLITIPALLAAGVPPVAALGTNKLQACAGSGTASALLWSKKQVTFTLVKWSMLTAFVGAIVGALLVQSIEAKILEWVIPVVICLIVAYFLFAPKPKSGESEPKVSQRVYRATAVPVIGFYDGMFGPATGSFFVLSGVSLRGLSIISSTVIAKTLNFATNVASLLVFMWFDQVAYLLGLIMMLGQFVGASLGAKALMTINPGALRGLVVVVCLVMLAVWLAKH